MKLPKHMSLSINHNEHRTYYRSMRDYIFDEGSFERNKIMSEDEIKRCLENDEIWEIHWYPRTPISFEHVCAPTLEECFKKIEEMREN